MKHLLVCFEAMLALHALFAQPTDACDWKAELLDVTRRERSKIVRLTTRRPRLPWSNLTRASM
jgi:hypothetical protein